MTLSHRMRLLDHKTTLRSMRNMTAHRRWSIKYFLLLAKVFGVEIQDSVVWSRRFIGPTTRATSLWTLSIAS